MAFNRSDYVKVKESFDKRRKDADNESKLRIKVLGQRLPELGEICRRLDSTGPRVYEAALAGKDGFEQRIALIKQETEQLIKQQEQILTANGYPADYLDVKYKCPVCRDEGNIDGKMCECMRRELIAAGYESAGISALVGTMSFESFDLSYYSGADLENMKYVLGCLKKYADGFHGKGSGSVLLCGGTGLGKTHLSVAAAKRVVELGNYVVYDTAENIFSDFRYERFDRSYDDRSSPKTDKYYECDLLVIDDLGTELGGRAVVSFLYNLLNTRINSGASTLISTNLTYKEILSTYDDRIASRLFGEFLPYKFSGKDIRMQKLKGGK